MTNDTTTTMSTTMPTTTATSVAAGAPIAITEPIDVPVSSSLIGLLQGDRAPTELADAARVRVENLDSGHNIVWGKTVEKWLDTDLRGELAKALSLDPYTLLLQGWSQLRKVREAMDKSKGARAEPVPVALSKHAIDVKIEPTVVVSVMGADCRAMKLGVTLEASFESARLVFERGALTSLETGKPKGTLKASLEGHELKTFERTLRFARALTFDPPLRFEFGAGRRDAVVLPTGSSPTS